MSLISIVFEVVHAGYTVVASVSDVVLNYEYIERKWIEEYILSIVLLVTSGITMGIIGTAFTDQTRQHENVYTQSYMDNGQQQIHHEPIKPRNRFLNFLFGVFQIRTFTDTYALGQAKLRLRKAELHEKNVQDEGGDIYSTGIATDVEIKKNQVQQIKDNLMYSEFILANIREVPLCILQLNATIHYRKFKPLDLWTSFSTSFSLLFGVTSFLTKADRKVVRMASGLFLLGQFLFRAGTFMLVAATKGKYVYGYALLVSCTTFLSTIFLRLGRPENHLGAQVSRAILYFPMFLIFTVDISELKPHEGRAKHVLGTRKLWLFHLYRLFENIGGLTMALLLPRYADIKEEISDDLVKIISGCLIEVYIMTFAIFLCCVNYCGEKKETSVAILQENNMQYLQNSQPIQHNPSPHYNK